MESNFCNHIGPPVPNKAAEGTVEATSRRIGTLLECANHLANAVAAQA